ncbi:MAG TPA: hypothetical protein VFA22_06930 [Stellaceae bacterium]|nr:hypothetical protein [Stellaceae bacterium]
MWFAVAIIGMIAAAVGVTLLPGGAPQKAPPPALTAPASPAPAAPATGTGH